MRTATGRQTRYPIEVQLDFEAAGMPLLFFGDVIAIEAGVLSCTCESRKVAEEGTGKRRVLRVLWTETTT